MIKKDVDYQSAIDLIHELLKDENLSTEQKNSIICRLSGLKAEKETAYRLKGYFANKKDIFVLNNIKLFHNEQNVQIDHLVLSRKGMYFVESKSVADSICVNEYNEWFRYYGKTPIPINSPVEQVNFQGKKLFAFLKDNLAKFRKSLLGLQGQIGYYLEHYFVAISEKGKIYGKGRSQYKDVVMKYDMIPKAIENLENQTLLQLVIDGNCLQRSELEALANLLLESDISNEPQEEIQQWAIENGLIDVEDKSQQQDPIDDLKTCPSCQQATRVIRYGKYGYYFSCESCGDTFSIREKCPSCDKPARISKKKESYYLVCSTCGISLDYFVNPVTQLN